MKKRLTRNGKMRKLTPARHGGRHGDSSSNTNTSRSRH